MLGGGLTFLFVIAKPILPTTLLPNLPKLDLRRDDIPWIAGHHGELIQGAHAIAFWQT